MKTKELIDFLLKQDEKSEWIIANKYTKKGKTLAQNNTIWKIFTAIGNKLGYTKEWVKLMTLQAMYGVTKIRIFGKDTYVPNKCSLKDLDIEQSSILIEESLEYAKKIRAPVEITAREMKDLYESGK